MSYTRAAMFDAQRSLGFGSIGASYAIVGSTLFYKIRMLIVKNQTDALLQFSSDGATDHFVLDTGEAFILDIATNDAQEDPWFIPAGQGIYVKRIGTPTSGSVYVSALYGRND